MTRTRSGVSNESQRPLHDSLDSGCCGCRDFRGSNPTIVSFFVLLLLVFTETLGFPLGFYSEVKVSFNFYFDYHIFLGATVNLIVNIPLHRKNQQYFCDFEESSVRVSPQRRLNLKLDGRLFFRTSRTF